MRNSNIPIIDIKTETDLTQLLTGNISALNSRIHPTSMFYRGTNNEWTLTPGFGRFDIKKN